MSASIRTRYGRYSYKRWSSVYSGYLDVDQGAKHLFFYFFESRRHPETGA